MSIIILKLKLNLAFLVILNLDIEMILLQKRGNHPIRRARHTAQLLQGLKSVPGRLRQLNGGHTGN